MVRWLHSLFRVWFSRLFFRVWARYRRAFPLAGSGRASMESPTKASGALWLHVLARAPINYAPRARPAATSNGGVTAGVQW